MLKLKSSLETMGKVTDIDGIRVETEEGWGTCPTLWNRTENSDYCRSKKRHR